MYAHTNPAIDMDTQAHAHGHIFANFHTYVHIWMHEHMLRRLRMHTTPKWEYVRQMQEKNQVGYKPDAYEGRENKSLASRSEQVTVAVGVCKFRACACIVCACVCACVHV